MYFTDLSPAWPGCNARRSQLLRDVQRLDVEATKSEALAEGHFDRRPSALRKVIAACLAEIVELTDHRSDFERRQDRYAGRTYATPRPVGRLPDGRPAFFRCPVQHCCLNGFHVHLDSAA